MRRLCWAIAALVLGAAAGSAAAQGCGPTRLKVAETVTLTMSPARAWALLGDFQDLSWDPAVAGLSGSGGNVPDKAVRTVTLRSGATVTESLYRYDADAMSYSTHFDRVDLATLPIQNASATLEVAPTADGAGSVVRWKVAFYRNLVAGEGAADAADARAVAAMKGFLRSGLEGLRAPPSPRS